MPPTPPTNHNQNWSMLGFAFELGYSLAIPIVFFVLVGRLLDKKFNTSPWLLLVGVLLSLIISTLTVYSKATKIIASTNDADALSVSRPPENKQQETNSKQK